MLIYCVLVNQRIIGVYFSIVCSLWSWRALQNPSPFLHLELFISSSLGHVTCVLPLVHLYRNQTCLFDRVVWVRFRHLCLFFLYLNFVAGVSANAPFLHIAKVMKALSGNASPT